MDDGFSDQTHCYRFHVGKDLDHLSTTPYEPAATALGTYERLTAEHGVGNVRIQKKICRSGLISPDQL